MCPTVGIFHLFFQGLKARREKAYKESERKIEAPLSLYCSPLMALTVKVCESSSLGEMTAPAKGNVPLGFWCRNCSFTKYSSSPASLFSTKNLETAQKAQVSGAKSPSCMYNNLVYNVTNLSIPQVPNPGLGVPPVPYIFLFSLLQDTTSTQEGLFMS